MWIALTFLFAGSTLALHGWWRRRCRLAEAEAGRWRQECERLTAAHERDRVSAALRQAALFDSMVEGVLILDPQGRVQLVNASFRRLLKLSEDVTGKTIMEALRLQALQQLLADLAARGSVTDFELEPNTLHGQTLQVNAVRLAARGETGAAGAMLVFHDLTRIKQLENARKDFVANVSHELRTPLAMIKGYVETLLDGAKDDPEIAAKFLRTIEKHADRLTFLIEDLLNISQLESGQTIVTLQPLALADIGKRVIDDLRPPAAEQGTGIISQLPAGLRIRGDASRLQQVLFNLVDNAIKYGRKGGRIEIGARADGDGLAEVWVADDGPGIPPEAQARVFERFYRVDKARSREAGGTGLGLAIVKHIIQAHGGDVWVDAQSRVGARFCFTVPLCDPPPPGG